MKVYDGDDPADREEFLAETARQMLLTGNLYLLQDGSRDAIVLEPGDLPCGS